MQEILASLSIRYITDLEERETFTDIILAMDDVYMLHMQKKMEAATKK